MQVAMNKFFLNPKKSSAQICFVVFQQNAKIHTLILKNDVAELKVGYSNYS